MKTQNIPKEATGWQVMKDGLRIIFRNVDEITKPKPTKKPKK